MECLSRFFCRQMFDVTEGEDGAKTWGQTLNGTTEDIRELALVEYLLGIGPPLGKIAGNATVFGLNVLVHGDCLRGFALAQAHQALVDGDAGQPGRELGVALELIEFLVGLEEGILGDVFGVFAVLGNVLGDAKDLPLVLADELGECGCISSAGSLDQSDVGVDLFNSGCFNGRHRRKVQVPRRGERGIAIGTQRFGKVHSNCYAGRAQVGAWGTAKDRGNVSGMILLVRAHAPGSPGAGHTGHWGRRPPLREIDLMSWMPPKLLPTALLLFLLNPPTVGQEISSPHARKTAGSGQTVTSTKKAVSKSTSKPVAGRSKTGKAKASASRSGKKAVVAAKGRRPSAAPSPQTLRLASAFRATTELRPMAQQLAAQRSPAAYAGVLAYAQGHPGDPASAAYLALGHAYSLDHRYPEAVGAFQSALTGSDVLSDYADYLGAQAAIRANRLDVAAALLRGFAERHPDSIFLVSAPVLLANLTLQQGDAPGAVRLLDPLRDTATAKTVDFRYALGRAYQVAGQTAQATALFRGIYTQQPLTTEAVQARQQLQAMGQGLTAAQRKVHADELFNAKHYADAADEYHSIQRDDATLSQADRDALTIYAAVCDYKLKKIGRREVEKLPTTTDDSGALKMYLLAELSRSEGDRSRHDALITQMVAEYPASRWLEEALYSGGNMYLLLHDSGQAIYHYALLTKMFPTSTYGPSAHWRTAWMNYRQRNYAEAARLMEEQIERYPGGQEIPSALYWRARIYEDEEHSLPAAAAFYKALSGTYTNYFYAGLARQRLNVLGTQPVVTSAVLAGVRRPETPELTGELPEDDPHLIKARLLANASLNEYIGPEIQASPTAGEWGALGQAEIYSSYGEVTRSLQSMKHSGISFFALPMDEVPLVYWRLLFPKPFWEGILADAQSSGLDPYLVASLIRQESEFNASAVSRANAYGLMQILPSVGKSIAKKRGLKGFNPGQLLVPAVNLQLGTINLREVLDRFGGQPEYALAAYNAGDVPVRQWMSSNDYKDVAEFVESIPYTETREYVQAILRNREMYRALYAPR